MTQPTFLMQNYWTACRARGDKPKKIYGLVSRGGEQPPGYVLAWSTYAPDIARRLDARGDPQNWQIEEFLP